MRIDGPEECAYSECRNQSEEIHSTSTPKISAIDDHRSTVEPGRESDVEYSASRISSRIQRRCKTAAILIPRMTAARLASPCTGRVGRLFGLPPRGRGVVAALSEQRAMLRPLGAILMPRLLPGPIDRGARSRSSNIRWSVPAPSQYPKHAGSHRRLLMRARAQGSSSNCSD
jgi:hypothetical protein